MSLVVTRDILVWGDKQSLVGLKSRIQLLFGVGLNFASPSARILARGDGAPESEWIKVYGPSEDACLKTQKYVLAACRPDCAVVVPCGTQLFNLLFNKPNKLRDAIEKEYQTLVLPSADGGILVQGSESAVSFTITRLQSLMDTLKQQQMTSKEHELNDLNAVDNISNSLLLVGISRSKKEITPPSSPRTSRRQKRVKQFVDLGYPKDKVEMVIESLGEASDNDIMARLVSIHSSYDVKPPTVHSKPPEITQPVHVPLSINHNERLRPIVIDGSNIAMSHGNGSTFSCRGILIAVNWFIQRGHKEITVFVPQWRKEPSRPETPISDQDILFDLGKSNIINFTPSRRVRDKKIVCYDDRFIVRLAAERGGVIVSNDHFRDLLEENPEWREAIENRLLMYTFVGDTFMVPSDPLGKHGPHLDVFLRFEVGKSPLSESANEHPVPRDKQPCPYKEKCTFGPRCRYYHPERELHKSETRDPSPTVQYSISPTHDYNKKSELTLPVKAQFYPISPPQKQHQYPGPGPIESSMSHRILYPTIPLGMDRAFSPTSYGMPPRDAQWIRNRDDGIPRTVARGGTMDTSSYVSAPDPFRSFPRMQHPEYGPTTPTYPDQYIDSTHRGSFHGSIKTAPLPHQLYHPPVSRPHTTHVSTYRPAHHQSIYEAALLMYPNDQERVKYFFHYHPHVNDINILKQYMNR